jgi:hypothetical protein
MGSYGSFFPNVLPFPIGLFIGKIWAVAIGFLLKLSANNLFHGRAFLSIGFLHYTALIPERLSA